MKQTRNFTEGQIFSPLIRFALPVLMALFLQTITIVITGLAMGLTVFVGVKIGAGQKEEAGRIIGSGIYSASCGSGGVLFYQRTGDRSK